MVTNETGEILPTITLGLRIQRTSNFAFPLRSKPVS